MEGNLPFLPRFTCVFEGSFQVQAPRGPYISRGNLTEGFLRYEFVGLIFRILRYLSTERSSSSCQNDPFC